MRPSVPLALRLVCLCEVLRCNDTKAPAEDSIRLTVEMAAIALVLGICLSRSHIY